MVEFVLFLILATSSGMDVVEQERFGSHQACVAKGEAYVLANPGLVRGYLCKNGKVTSTIRKETEI